MSTIFFSLCIINLLLLFNLIVTDRADDDIDQLDAFDSLLSKHTFVNQIENQREYAAVLNKRHRLARMKFEEHCESKGKIVERICPTIEQCLSTEITNDQIQQPSLRVMLEDREDANQFLHIFNRNKRFFLSSLINTDDNYKERNVHERRRKGLLLYEHYCESTDRLPRSCPQIDRCKCGDCNN